MLALILAAVAVGLGNFAVAISIGLSDSTTAARIKVATVFGLFESGMPVVGLVLGRGIATTVGQESRYGGGGLLIAIGAWSLWRASRSVEIAAVPTGIGRLVLTALALSMDNLVVGFGLSGQHASLLASVLAFAVVSVTLSVVGLEFGRRLGAVIESRAEYLAGAVLVLVGCMIIAGIA